MTSSSVTRVPWGLQFRSSVCGLIRRGASRRNGSRRPRTSLLLPTCLASGSTLCTAEGHPVASCSTWVHQTADPTKRSRILRIPPGDQASTVTAIEFNPGKGKDDELVSATLGSKLTKKKPVLLMLRAFVTFFSLRLHNLTHPSSGPKDCHDLR